jgi:nitroreductase
MNSAENSAGNFSDLVKQSRSIRRFYQDRPVALETLRELIDLARLAPTGSNRQSLRFLLSCDADRNAAIFPHLGWAGYLRDWPGPVEGERPAAYILIFNDTTLSKTPGCDHGIAAQTILLGAREKGLGGCMIGSVQREELRQALGIDPRYEIALVLALGWPKEQVVVEPLPEGGDVRYWRDAEGVHHVPKRSLEELILG